MFERLESRRLFAGVVTTFSGGLLTITGGSKHDVIVVNEDAGNVHVEVNYQPGADYAGVTGILVKGGGAGDDIYHTGNTLHPKIYGNSGNDQLSVADYGTASSYVDGGGGSDSITLIHGNGTTIHGGDGKDAIYVNTDGDSSGTGYIFGDGSDDTVTVYAGTNTISDKSGNDTYLVGVSGPGGTNTITDNGGTNKFYLYNGNNTATGAGGNDTFYLNGGTNTANGAGSTDTFYANGGVNTLNGGDGNDIFHTYPGSVNQINGGGGTDTVYNHSGGGVNTYTSIEKTFAVA